MDATLFQKGILPMVVAVTGILAPVLVVALVLWFRHVRQEALYALVRQFAQQGLPVPRELIDPPRRYGAARLTVAFTLVGAGLGLAVMFWMMGERGLSGIGALPLLIGVFQGLAIWLETRLETRLEPGQSPKP